MTTEAKNEGRRRWSPWRVTAWGFAAGLLLLPLIAMRYTDEVNWTGSDFVFMGVLLGSVGLAFEFIVRKSGSLAYRFGAALTLIAAFLTIWVNAAVGMIGDGPYNLLFGGVLLIALIGAIVARFEPAGMARAMVVAAIAQGVLSAVGMSTDARGGILSMTFVVPWLLAAELFRKAARDRRSAGSAQA